jgi:cell division protein FtsB
MVAQLLRENRALKAENQRLSRELERLSKGWEDIRRLARSAPRSTSRRRASR